MPHDSPQLDLFDTTEPHQAAQRGGICPAIARASVSPGWWPLVRPLFAAPDDDIVVTTCVEVDGVLQLEARFGEPLVDMSSTTQRIRELAAETCGCCGATGARAHRDSWAGPTRVLCDRCRERIRSGEAFLSVADDYWALDGSRRLGSFHRPSRTSKSARPASSDRRPCTTLPPDELRRAIADVRAVMAEDIVAQDDAVGDLALLAGLHVGGGLTRGARALIIGPSGTGKSASIASMIRGIHAGGWDVPVVTCSALELNSPGWHGAPSIGELLERAIGDQPPDSPQARHAIVVIDEIHHAGVLPGLEGNMLAKRREVLASLLDLLGHGTVLLGQSGRTWSSREALVIGMGAFTGLLDTARPPAVENLVRAGLPLECASRFEAVIRLSRLPERELVRLLTRWPALVSLTDVCTRLGYTVRIHDETVARAARAVASGHDGATARTAGGWLVAALRQALIVALATPEAQELAITPDSLTIPRAAASRRPPEDPPDAPHGWDATIILTPR